MYVNGSVPQNNSNFYRKVANEKMIRGQGGVPGMARRGSATDWGNSMVGSAGTLATLGGGQVSRMAMKPFSPLYQESNLMLPKDRKTMNAYNRHYYETDYWVGNIIDLHTYYPLGGFDIISKDKVVEHTMRRAADKVDLLNHILGIGLEYWVYGEGFPFLEWDDNIGMWSRATIFNPDLMEVRRTIFMDKPIISLIPDAELKRIATSTHPADAILRQQIPQTVLDYVLKGENIPLSSRNVSHILKKTVPHDLRGTSIIQRVWKELMLRDAFREVLFVIAQNHITPLKIFRVGGKDKEFYPDQNDLTVWQGIIEEAQNDPNFSIITHEALEVEYKGFTGQILDVNGYFEKIQDHVLTGLFASKAVTTAEGPCTIAGTEVLTKDGFKKIDDCTCDDEVGSVNPDTGALEYVKPKQKFEFDVTGPMYHFSHKLLDHCVTPNHRCWVKGPKHDKTKEGYGITLAEDIGAGYRFKSVINWSGKKRESIVVGSKTYDINKYLKFIGLYLSEGSLLYNGTTPCGVSIAQTRKHKFGKNPRYDMIKEAVLSFNKDTSEYQRTYASGDKGSFAIYDSKLAAHIQENYAEGSASKCIPTWVKDLSKDHLEAVLEGCFLGDGSKYGHKDSYEIYTISRKMADDLQEIALKCGHATKVITKKRNAPRHTMYRVIVFVAATRNYAAEPTVALKNIKTFDYVGKVYSFDLPPNRIYVTRRNGLITVTGNTYSNAQVAYEILQKRYVYFRNVMERWLETKFFLPIAIMHGFKKPNGEYDLPQVKWTRMDFNKDDAWRNKIIELNRPDHKLISDRTIVTELGFDYDEEQDLLRSEKAAKLAEKAKAKQEAAGGAGAAGGMGGALGGGMPDLGGGGGGGMPDLGGAEGAPGEGAPLGAEAAPPGGAETTAFSAPEI